MILNHKSQWKCLFLVKVKSTTSQCIEGLNFCLFKFDCLGELFEFNYELILVSYLLVVTPNQLSPSVLRASLKDQSLYSRDFLLFEG